MFSLEISGVFINYQMVEAINLITSSDLSTFAGKIKAKIELKNYLSNMRKTLMKIILNII